MFKLANVLAGIGVGLSMLSPASAEWRDLDPDRVLVMTMPAGEVWIELAPQFAPKHVANIKQLVEQKYFDGAEVVRSQENYVVQWERAASDDQQKAAQDLELFGDAKSHLPMEFFEENNELNFTSVESKDSYASKVGYVDGFPVASDGKKSWLVHCYGMVGVGRGMERDSGNGSSLYTVIGHSPRHLDKNVTLVGRVVKGMQWLSTLPRGTGVLGFYESVEERTMISSIRLGSHPSFKDQINLKIMHTSSSAFKQRIKDRTTRKEQWFAEATGKIEVCNVGVPSKQID